MSADGDLTAFAAGRRVAAARIDRYIPGGSLWSLSHCLPMFSGLALKAVFDRVGRGPHAAGGALPLLAVFVACEVARVAAFWSANAVWPSWFHWAGSQIRSNLLASVVVAPGAPSARLPGSAGEAVARFRDDVDDVTWFVDIWVDLAGGIVFTVVAVAVMFSISPLVTVVVVLPLVVVGALTRALSHRLRRYHSDERASGAAVTAFVADLFSCVLTLKTSGAEDAALAEFRRRNETRGDAAVRAQLYRDLLVNVTGASVDVSIGLVLLLAAPAMRSGRFTVGDLALFTAYASWLTRLPQWIGRLMARHRQAGVSLARLARIDASGRVDGVVARRAIDLRNEKPFAPPVPDRPPALRRLEARGVTVDYGAGRPALDGVDLAVDAGSFTVVTGAVGAGKTTLVRALLGLVEVDAGSVAWNGEVIDDPSATLRAPYIGYVAQIPRLLSASLEENLGLGWPVAGDDVAAAMSIAQLNTAVAELPAGLATRVGPRGSHLSGGQAQRATLARALVRRPELLVIDDASSALDVETEAALWRTLRGAGIGCLVVSHRRAALEQADHIVVLADGNVVGTGDLASLLTGNAEFARLWHGELLDDAAAG